MASNDNEPAKEDDPPIKFGADSEQVLALKVRINMYIIKLQMIEIVFLTLSLI